MSNRCRTCRHWTPRPHAIGLGFCCSSEVSQKVVCSKTQDPFYTAQDFGCVNHQPGERNIAPIYSESEQTRIWLDFLGSRTNTDKPSL